MKQACKMSCYFMHYSGSGKITMKHMKADLVEFPSFILKLNTKNKTFLQTCLANTISKMMIKYVHLISSILYRYIHGQTAPTATQY